MKVGFDETIGPFLRFRIIGRAVVSAGIVFVLLFVAAGRWDWWQAWAYFGIWVLNYLCNYILIPSDLVRERITPGPGAKGWDKAITWAVSIPLTYIIPLVAALDGGRFRLSGDFTLGGNVLALTVVFLGYALLVLSLWSNRFFSILVRVQKDKEQRVVDTGPYAFLRHPGYAGLAAASLALPFALNSFWALVPAGLLAGMLVLRTRLEDDTLRRELCGYAEYAAWVRYRLIPGVW